MAHKYTLQTLFGGGMNAGLIGGSACKVKIWRTGIEKVIALYDVVGFQAGVSLDLYKSKLPVQLSFYSTPSDFESEVNGLTVFGGTVRFGQTDLNTFTENDNYQKMVWVSGAAKGTVCEGDGTGYGVHHRASVGISIGILNFKFVSLLGDDLPAQMREGGQAKAPFKNRYSIFQ